MRIPTRLHSYCSLVSTNPNYHWILGPFLPGPTLLGTETKGLSRYLWRFSVYDLRVYCRRHLHDLLRLPSPSSDCKDIEHRRSPSIRSRVCYRRFLLERPRLSTAYQVPNRAYVAATLYWKLRLFYKTSCIFQTVVGA